MLALLIVLGILLLLFLITLIKVEIFAHYSESLTLVLKVLFFKITLVPSDKKPKKKKNKSEKEKPKEKKPEQKQPKKKEKKKKHLGKLKDKKGLSGIVSLVTSLAKIAAGALKGVFSHIVIKKLDVGITLSGEDAASVAVTYGRLCSVFYPAVNIITAAAVCNDYHVTIEPVFNPDKDTEIYADVHAYLRIIFALWEAIKAAIKLLIVRMKL